MYTKEVGLRADVVEQVQDLYMFFNTSFTNARQRVHFLDTVCMLSFRKSASFGNN